MTAHRSHGTPRFWAANLLHTWFVDLGAADWFGGSVEVDNLLRHRFADRITPLSRQAPEQFMDGPHAALAAVLLFDQLPRNLWRGTAHAFAHDRLARAITHGALKRGYDEALRSDVERQFLAMPLMHSEGIADQRLSLRFFAELGPRYGWGFARSHYAMVARFGRFPHRNDALGRKSTPAEERAVAAGFSW